MRTRDRILGGVGLILVAAVTWVAVMFSHEKECPAPQALQAGAPSMQAVMHRCYGGTESLSLETIARPVPADDQVLVRVHAAAVNPYDWHMMTGMPYIMRADSGFGAPERADFGVDYAGTVEAIGAMVVDFKVGDNVFGGKRGAFGQYVVVREKGIITRIPDGMSFEEAAAIPLAGITALQGLRDKGQIGPGQKVLINGASGGVGIYAVQIAKAYGAEVTGVCSTRNVEMVRSLGADHVIDYTKQNFTQGTERYDLVLDNVGNHSFSDLRRVLTAQGSVVVVGGRKDNVWVGPMPRMAMAALLSHFIEERFVPFIADMSQADVKVLADLAREGKLRSVIDRRYPLEQIAAALAYVGGKHARGKVVVQVQ